MNNLLKMSVKGATKAQAAIKRYKTKSKKAMNTAIKIEAFRLRKKLKHDLSRGAPGGRDLLPLSHIARNLFRNKNRKPLAKLGPGVRYRVTDQNPFTIEIGFIQSGPAGLRRLAKKHQEGFTQLITPDQKGWIIGRGAKLGKIEGGDTPFFLRKSTRSLTTPGRPIIDPFWAANKTKAGANIRRNFKAKLSGKRI